MDERETDDTTTTAAPKSPELLSMGTLIGIGAGLGMIAGTLLDSLALGLAIGAGLGTVAGAIVESSRRHG